MTVQLTCIKGVCPAYPMRRSNENTRIPDFQFKISYELWKPINHVSSSEKINLLFIHGAQLNKEIWRYHIELLYQRLGDILGVCIAADNVDHGDSYLMNEKAITFYTTVTDSAKDMCCLLRHINEPGRNIVIGHSLGGAICNYMAFLEPVMMDSIVAFDPIMYEEPELFDSAQYKDIIRKLIAKVYENVQTEFKTRQEFDDFIDNKHIARVFNPRVRRDLAEGLLKPRKSESDAYTVKVPAVVQLSGYICTFEALKHGRNISPVIPHEVLHIIGSVYDWQTPRNIEGYQKSVRNITTVTIKDAGHNVPYQKPEEACDVIADFIRRRLSYKEPVALSPDEGYRQFMEKTARHEDMIYSKL